MAHCRELGPILGERNYWVWQTRPGAILTFLALIIVGLRGSERLASWEPEALSLRSAR